jgi:hypothetical protein
LTRASRRLATLGHGLALIAVIAQIAVPLIKGSHVSRERSPIAAPAFVAREHGGAAQIAARSDDAPHAHHDDAACPVCRLIGQSRGALLTAPHGVADVPFVRHAASAAADIGPQTFSANAAAPRAPPRSLT